MTQCPNKECKYNRKWEDSYRCRYSLVPCKITNDSIKYGSASSEFVGNTSNYEDCAVHKKIMKLKEIEKL